MKSNDSYHFEKNVKQKRSQSAEAKKMSVLLNETVRIHGSSDNA